MSFVRRFLRRLDRHTLEMCRPGFPYDRLVGRAVATLTGQVVGSDPVIEPSPDEP